LSVADHGFISGVIVSLLTLNVADHGFISSVIVTTFKVSRLTITLLMNP
jgi:hypothetical protein